MSSSNQSTQATKEIGIPLPMQSVVHPSVEPVIPIKEPALKRPHDFVLSSIGLILSAPLWLAIALAIKLEDGGPLLYTQERWGQGGNKFKVRKFRTMVPNAAETFGNMQAKENDDRVTRVGKVLRDTGMDELPQLLNIWKGEMSLVGPRALAVDEIVHDENGNVLRYEEVPGFHERQSVRPGLTGIATVYKPKDIHPQDKFHYDLLYIRNQSFWLDLRLIALSFWISFRGKWETRGKKV